MTSNNQTEWVWVFIINPGADEQILGQYDKKQDVSYIPVFSSKEFALQCYNLLTKTADKKYEATAIMIDDLAEQARAGNFMLYFLDGEGKVADTQKP